MTIKDQATSSMDNPQSFDYTTAKTSIKQFRTHLQISFLSKSQIDLQSIATTNVPSTQHDPAPVCKALAQLDNDEKKKIISLVYSSYILLRCNCLLFLNINLTNTQLQTNPRSGKRLRKKRMSQLCETKKKRKM